MVIGQELRGTGVRSPADPTVHRRDDHRVRVRAEVPGIDPAKDVEITVDDNMLRIAPTRQSTSEDTQDGRFHSEFR